MLIQLAAAGHSIEDIEQTPEFKSLNRMISYAMTEVTAHALSVAFRDIDRAFQNLLNSEEMDFAEMHRAALEKRLDEPVAREDLLSLTWSIARNESNDSWILPDSAILELSQDDEYSPFLFAKSAERKAIILPLASDCVLIGRTSPEADVDLAKLNAGAASCSYEFFIAAENSDSLIALSEEIGASVNTGVKSTVSGVLDTIYDLSSSRVATPVEHLVNLEFQGHDIPLEKDEFRELASKVVPHFRYVSEYFDLNRLTRVLVATDIETAYNEMFPSNPVQLGQEDLRRQAWWKEVGTDTPEYTLFLSYAVVSVLADAEHEAFDFAYELFMQELAHLHVRAIVTHDASNVGIHALHLDEEIGAFVRDISVHAVCTFMDTHYGIRIVQADISSLTAEVSRLVQALEAYFALDKPEGDEIELNNKRALAMSNALTSLMFSAARYCAYCQHFGVSVVDRDHCSEVADAMEEYNLTEWIERLDFDFQRLRVNFFSPLDSNRIRAIQLHTERLLWARGAIFVPINDQGWIQTISDKLIDYEAIRRELETFVLAAMPENISDSLLNAFGGRE